MIATYSDSTFTSRSSSGSSDLKATLLEPFLIVGVSAFWLVTLPFAAIGLLAVKIWDTVTGFARGTAKANPLILRRGESTGNDSPTATRTSTKHA